MKIIVASTIVPFIDGGGRMIVDDLASVLKRFGHQVDVIKLPFWSDWSLMPEQMLSIRLLDVSEHSDLLICVRSPSYLLQHDRKVVWFISHHRGAYDLWGTEFQDIPNSAEGLQVRDAIVASDNVGLREARALFTNSRIVSERLRRFNSLESEVLYPPLLDSASFYCAGYGDFIFYPSRITRHKRQYLAVESMKYVTTGVRLVIAGSPDSPEHLENLFSAVRTHGVSDRVTILDRWISQQEKIKMFSECLAGMYIPFDEDSYGYVSLESFHAGKPVVTCSDSGGTLELIQDGINGLVAQPDAKSIAAAMDRLMASRSQTEAMGQAALRTLQSLNISWEHVVGSLTR